MGAEGLQHEQSLREAGFTEPEIDQWKTDTAGRLSQAGFSGQEVGDYFGVPKEPDMTAMKQYFEKNLASATQPTPVAGSPELQATAQPRAAMGFLDGLDAGWQMSVSGLIKRGKLPDVMVPENAGIAARMAYQIGEYAGDVPAIIAGYYAGAAGGGAAGGAAGTAIPGIGNVAGATGGAILGAGAGSMALPAAAREILVQHYEKGDIQDFGDFWERSNAVLWKSLKAGATGAATLGVGSVVGKTLTPLVAPALKTVGTAASEIATMVSVGKALEGQVPNAQDFVEAAIFVGGLHAAPHVAGKLRTVYAKTGLKPAEVAEMAAQDPTIKQDLASSNIPIPRALEPAIDPAARVESTRVELNSQLDTPHNVLGEGDAPKVSLSLKPAESVPTAPVPESGPTESSPASNPVLDRIKPSRETKLEPSWDKFYTAAVDDLHPVKQFTDILSGGKPLPVTEDPYALARLTRGSYGKADQFLELSPFKFDTLENTGQPLKKILKPFKQDLDGIRAYAVASRAVELEGRGVQTGIPLDGPGGARELLKDGAPKYEKAFQELVQFQNDTLAYLKDSGIVSGKGYEQMLEANKSYVPFFRLLEEGGGGKSAAGRGLQVKNPIREIKGSERPVIDPLESIVKNTYAYVTLAEKNRVMRSMVDLAKSNEELGSQLMERVQTPMQPIEVKAEEVSRFLEEHGIPGDAEAFTIFRPGTLKLASDEVPVFQDGKMEIYRVDPEVAKAVRAMDRESAGLFIKILAAPAKLLRGGSVLAPDFMVRNAVRDQITAFNLSKNGFIPIYDSLKGLGSLLTKDADYQAWLKSGGANSALVAIDRAYIEENVFKLSKETGLIDKTWNVIRSPLEALRVSSELIENATRLGEFKRAMEGASGAEAIFSAGLESREVTLDFARIGAQTRAMNMITAFWNAHVQGLDREIRAIRENPLGMTAKLAASITLPSILSWWANHKDPRYKEIPNWQKNLFWIFMTDKWEDAPPNFQGPFQEGMTRTIDGRMQVNNGHVYRVPKPAELGVLFGSLPERVLEFFFDQNPKALKDFDKTMAQGMIPEYLPSFAIPVIEQFANRSTFTGSPIVPFSSEKLLPEYQYTDYTTESGKMLGKLVGAVPYLGDMGPQGSKLASPPVVENYVRAWSGTMGGYALQLADRALELSNKALESSGFKEKQERPAKPSPTLSDIPFVKAFVVRYPSASAQSIQDFNERYRENETTLMTIRKLAQDGDAEATQKLLDADPTKLYSLQGVHEAITKQEQMIHKVYLNLKMTRDEKRQIIDSLYLGMINVANSGNQLIDEIDKSLKK